MGNRQHLTLHSNSEVSVYTCGVRFKYFAHLEEFIVYALSFFRHTVLNRFFSS